MSVNDELGTRMKEYYENIPKTKLMRRCPVAVHIDGKAFHSFTKGFKRPFDEVFIISMQETMKYLCENIQGCVLGFHQSNEITLILVDYKNLNSSAWFDYEVQKICSIAASMATMAFNKFFSDNIYDITLCFHHADEMDYEYLKKKYNITNDDFEDKSDDFQRRFEKYELKMGSAMFDARCFNIPKEEVTNLLYWRQLDATRNSIQMVGQAYFSHNELQNKSCNQIQDMLFQKKGINWNDFPTHQKRGSCCIKNNTEYTWANEENGVVTTGSVRPHWEIDLEIPIFKGEGRQYIEKLINFDTEEKIIYIN